MSDVPSNAPAERERGMNVFLKTALTLAVVGLAFTTMRGLSSIIAPTFLALNLLIVMYPLSRWLARVGLPRVLASVITLIVVFGVLALFIWGIAYSIAAMVTQLGGYTKQYLELYHSSLQLLSRMGLSQESLLSRIKGIDPSQVVGVVNSLISNAQGGLSLLLMVILALIFLGMDSTSAHRRMASIRHGHANFAAALTGFTQGVRRYWVVSTIFGLIVAVLDYFALLALGVPLPFVWAILSFLTNYIPNIGFVLGLLPPAIIALFDKGWVIALIVIIAYSVLNFVVQSIIQPKFTGDAVGLTATVSFLSLFLWTWVFGALGALIAVPCSLAVKALVVDMDPSLRWIDAFIATNIPGEKDDAGDSPGHGTGDAAEGDADATLESPAAG